MRMVLASSNRHKAEEITAMLPPNFEINLQSDLGIDSAAETGTTFIENALIKARHASALTGMPAIADDSGLCVSALRDRPGIFSARYAGPNASDQDNMNKLLAELGSNRNRDAFFYCVMVFLEGADSAKPIIAEANWHGEISLAPSGTSGFGYDPVFYLPELSVTAAELAMSQKNSISHRGLALIQLKDKLFERYPV
ncbi:MAG: RdgB/HAM1 family non-canonical purine NTP pyrophosphatase [Pseudomonadota bacterium]|nr:RdgB/HAM1 family non-canonical purine NTP pyrophosphatase [Pseudomonadota bacterium]